MSFKPVTHLNTHVSINKSDIISRYGDYGDEQLELFDEFK